MHRHAIGCFLLGCCMTVAGCGDAPVPEPPGADARDAAGRPQTADDSADAAAGRAGTWQRCSNAAGGFVVEFPADWHTNPGTVMPTCTAFHTRSIVLPEASEMPADLVTISVDDVAFERVVDSSYGVRVLSREELQVAGRRAVRRIVEQSGEGLLDAGVRTVEYAVEWNDGRTLIGVAHSAGEPDFDTKQRVLQQMMERLTPAQR